MERALLDAIIETGYVLAAATVIAYGVCVFYGNSGLADAMRWLAKRIRQ